MDYTVDKHQIRRGVNAMTMKKPETTDLLRLLNTTGDFKNLDPRMLEALYKSLQSDCGASILINANLKNGKPALEIPPSPKLGGSRT